MTRRKMRHWRIWVNVLDSSGGVYSLTIIAMFFPNDNPGYYTLLEDAKMLIVEWSSEQSVIGGTEDDKLRKEL